MKSAYELALERLNKTAPVEKLTDRQKQAIAELNEKYQARIAEREIFLKDQINAAAGRGAFDEVGQLEKQLVSERKALQGELEEKKEAVRARR
jgi:molybdopterin converting factor small subunit